MLYRAIPFSLGLVLGRLQRHPARSLRALSVCLGRAVVIVLRFAQPLVCLPWRAGQLVDGPVARALVGVVGLIVLANLLASSSTLAGWATVFIVGASRGLTGARRGHSSSTTRRLQSATAGPVPFDAVAYAATLAPFSDPELRRKAREIAHALQGGDPTLTEEDRRDRVQQRRVIHETLDARRVARDGSSPRRP